MLLLVVDNENADQLKKGSKRITFITCTCIDELMRETDKMVKIVARLWWR
jgi:hypothetical protein